MTYERSVLIRMRGGCCRAIRLSQGSQVGERQGVCNSGPLRVLVGQSGREERSLLVVHVRCRSWGELRQGSSLGISWGSKSTIPNTD